MVFVPLGSSQTPRVAKTLHSAGRQLVPNHAFSALYRVCLHTIVLCLAVPTPQTESPLARGPRRLHP